MDGKMTDKERILIPLHKLVSEKGMTLVSAQTGIPRTHLWKILSDEGNPTLDSLLKIAKAIEVSFIFVPGRFCE